MAILQVRQSQHTGAAFAGLHVARVKCMYVTWQTAATAIMYIQHLTTNSIYCTASHVTACTVTAKLGLRERYKKIAQLA